MQLPTDYRLTMARSLIVCGPNSNPNPKYSFLVEIMENMDKGLTVPKWVLITSES